MLLKGVKNLKINFFIKSLFIRYLLKANNDKNLYISVRCILIIYIKYIIKGKNNCYYLSIIILPIFSLNI